MAPIQYIVVIAALPYLAFANQPDVLFPHYAVPFECLQQPDGGGCRAWAANDIHLFATGQATGQLPPGAANLCAIPGAATGSATGGPETASAGPFCYCANTGKAHWCLPMLDIPEQINLMYASPDVIVAGFVTYERAAPTTMAVATSRGRRGLPYRNYPESHRSVSLGLFHANGLRYATATQLHDALCEVRWAQALTQLHLRGQVRRGDRRLVGLLHLPVPPRRPGNGIRDVRRFIGTQRQNINLVGY